MILKYISLKNIRSYTSQRIDFPEGSVMLSGDIGSGKSTILLAAEFALFGIMKGDVSGESLLRNGKKEGAVELGLEINGKNVIINRVLKRASQGVKQDSGYIIVNGVKKAVTSTELKSEMLDILGYPRDLLTKSKGLIYRYTVYTPQEDMKAILFEDEEARLNTLRRVFDVDKYRRIRENAKFYMAELKGAMKEIEGSMSDMDAKKKQLGSVADDAAKSESRINDIKPKLKAAKEAVEQCGKEANEREKGVESLRKMRSELSLLDNELKNRVMQKQRNNSEIERIAKAVSSLDKEVEGKKAEDTAPLLKEKENSLRFMDDTRLKIARKIAEMESMKNVHASNKDKMKIDKCPTCLQDVGAGHKKMITERENQCIAALDSEIKIHSAQEKDAEEKIRGLRKEIEGLRKMQVEAERIKARISEIAEKRGSLVRLEKEQEAIKKSIGAINLKKIGVSADIDRLKDVEESYLKARKAYDDSRDLMHQVEIELNTFETDRKAKLAMAESLKAEIKRKEESRSRLQEARNLHHWLETDFISLMALMEKQVMAKVYHSFNELFQNWFSSLMEDESIAARLDDSFSPVVQQNGYDINVAYLSGGEKTSCALAYRLSLNKVINDLISTVQTKDIIILDEPTDGFSTEQLDRVREVIEQLGMRQVIIVSHEQKIEGFVDRVIRIQKNEHVSSVV